MGKKPCTPGPRNLRSAQNYSVGLDLGTNSVGWAVVDENGELYHVNGNKPTWGARLFAAAETAAPTRLKRGQRRRYNRRRQRIEALQEAFCEEMSKVDPEFFIRMRQSRLIKKDRNPQYETDYVHPFFNGTDFTESEYYKRFPTIWHLRAWLMETAQTGEKADVRLIYLALHNIVKYRGNFLHEDEGSALSAKNADAMSAARGLADALREYCDCYFASDDDDGGSWVCEPDVDAIRKALDTPGLHGSDRSSQIEIALGITGRKGLAKTIAKACVGYVVEFVGEKGLFPGQGEDGKTKFSLAGDEGVIGDFVNAHCMDDGFVLFEAIQRAYSAYVLAGILCGESSLSASMVASYNRHRDDLRITKELTREYLGLEEYRALFRGPKVRDPLNPEDSTPRYDYNKLPKKSYTAYVVRGSKASHCTQEDLAMNIRKKFQACPELLADSRYESIRPRLEADDGSFLAKQKTRNNGAIPYQLHLEEMTAIIRAQGSHYPFLLENEALLESLVSTRIPYYVGPLNTQSDPLGAYPNPVDNTRKFGWSVRREGMEGAKVYPWNVEEVIDTDATAERFIRRMTGTCTYLYGQDVLPRCSLLYEEFCVLNELNGVRWAEGSGEPHRFDAADRQAMVEELFKGRKSVPHRAVAEWLTKRHGARDVRIVGTQGEAAFESKLSSYGDFCRILGVRRLDENSPLTIDQIEEIILWSTVFEDRAILQCKLIQTYGSVLTEEQIGAIVRKRYAGWGRLSRAFLTGLKAQTSTGPMSIMDVLREGDPYPGRHLRALNLMEALRDKDLDFQGLVDKANQTYFEEHGLQLGIDDLQGSPALRRTVNQAMRVLDELVGIAGRQPARICIEETRYEDMHKKGKRSSSRYKKLKEAVERFRTDTGEYDAELAKELEENKDGLDDDRLMLYFAQGGKSLYSGRPLDIRRLQDYQVDHILPQSYIKDDSFDNCALVLAEENQRKLDTMLLDFEKVIRPMRRWWGQLKDAGLISEKKYARLTRISISDEQMRGFINRQLIETSQIVKFVRQLCEQRYPGTEIVTIRASLSSGLRDRCELVKCRELNDYHHAHDAYLACQMARFIECRYPSWRDGFDLAMVRKYVKRMGEEYGITCKMPGRSGFIVDSFMKSGFDKETGEVFKDAWDAEATIARMRTDLESKYCFISRMPEEMSGAFWDETVYSPRDTTDGKNLAMPLRQTGAEGYLDPKRYGGPNNVKQAYFFIFAAQDKKGRNKFFFEGVPIHLVQHIKQDDSGEALRAYAEQVAQAAGCSGAKVLREKVLFRQKLEIDGCLFYLGGKTNSSNWVSPGVQMWLPQNARTELKKNEVLSDETCRQVIEGVARACPRLYQQLDLEEKKDVIINLDDDIRGRIVHDLVAVLSGTKGKLNMKEAGGSANAGMMNLAFGSEKNLKRVVWIDQSVTGIFETRTSFEDLTRGL